MSNQHRINDSTLTDFGNIARAKTGESRLFTVEEIKTIFRLGSGDDSAIAELKALVTPKLPNMHIDKMNLIQFKWVYIWIIQEIADLPAHYTIDLTESATDVDENGNLVLYANGMPAVELNVVRVYDRQQIVKEAQDDYREQFDTALSEIVTEFELDVTLTETESLTDTLSNLSAVCEALSANSQNEYWESIKEWTENETNYLPLTKLFKIGSADNHVNLPYFNTVNAEWNISANGNSLNGYVNTIGISMKSAKSLQPPMFYDLHAPTIILSDVHYPEVSESFSGVDGGWSSIFNGKTALEELYTDGIATSGFLGGTGGTGVNRFYQLFNGCTNLRIIGGFNSQTHEIDDTYGEIDFTGNASTTSMFQGCSSLSHVRFKKETAASSFNIGYSPLLTKASVLSIINGLNSDSPQTVTFNSALQANMNTTWKAKFNSATEQYEDSEDEDAVLYSDIITTEKGWTLAWRN